MVVVDGAARACIHGPKVLSSIVPILQDIVLLSSSLCVYPGLCVSGGEVVTTASREADGHCMADIATAGIATDKTEDDARVAGRGHTSEDGPTEVSDHL